MLGREPTTVPLSTEALKANLLRLQNEWEAAQASRDRGAIYGYLTAVFEIVMVWAKEGKGINRARRTLHLRGHSSVREPEPFAAVILCTSDPDERTRSKRADRGRFVLIEGLHRLEAAKALGEKTIVGFLVDARKH
jgi:hypothetical protein